MLRIGLVVDDARRPVALRGEGIVGWGCSRVRANAKASLPRPLQKMGLVASANTGESAIWEIGCYASVL